MIKFDLISSIIVTVFLILEPDTFAAPIISENLGTRLPDISANVASLEMIVFDVTNTNNAGAGSLRQAILDANANAGGTDIITFNIAGTGPHVINLTSALPTITDSVVIDGTTEPDFTDKPIIVLDGTGAGSVSGLTLNENNITIRGLVINNFSQMGIVVNGNDNTIAGNFIGTDNTGMAEQGNGGTGIFLSNGASNNMIGGSLASDRNVIAGNVDDNIKIEAAAGSNNKVLGNYIGVDVLGTSVLGNGGSGIDIQANGNTVGGIADEERNIISGSLYNGIVVSGDGNILKGNYIGTDVSTTIDLGNGRNGIWINGGRNNQVGGIDTLSGNFIFNNGRNGVLVSNGTPANNQILRNSIYDNTHLGIDLSIIMDGDGFTINDPDDTDNGPNNLQNFPVISAASGNAERVNITGTLNSTPNDYFRVEFFASNSVDASGYGEGQRYLGSTNLVTDGSGDASFNTTLTAAVTAGESVSSTAIKSNAGFSAFTDASEFSEGVSVIDAITISTLIDSVTCRGLGDGAIDITVSGGLAPYTFDWLDIAGTDDPEDRTGLSAGLYTLTVTDANDQFVEEDILVSQPYNLTLSATNPFAALNITGSVNDPNPFPSFIFSGGWSIRFPADQETTFNYNSTYENEYIPDGYTLDPDWQGNCLLSYTKHDNVSTSNAFHTGASRVTEFHDFNPGDLVNASGDIYHIHGRGHFGFNSSPEGPHDWTVTYDFSALANGYLPAGTLIGFIDIDGENGLNENLLLTATGTTDPWLEVFDYTAGVPTHGTAAYNAPGKPANSYYFDGPPVSNAAIAYLTSQDLTSITINAKSAAGGGTIGMKLAAPLIPFVEEDVSCNGGSDGSTTVAVAGGTGPYEYLWSNGSTTKSITGLTAGMYSVTVSDANSCSDVLSQTIAEPALPLAATITDQTDILCYGNSTGSVTVEATAGTGTAPYQYSIDGSSFGSSGSFSSLLAGDYNVVVRDTNACIINIPVTISQPNELSGNISGSTQICVGDSTTITVQLTGGTQPWKVYWPGGSDLNVSGTEPYDFTFNTGPLSSTSSYGSAEVTLSDTNDCAGTIGGNAEITVNSAVGSPVFDLGATSSRCPLEEIITYRATASNSIGIIYLLDSVSIDSGNSIVAETGEVRFVEGWYGMSIITASAEGCFGPSSSTHEVTIEDLVDPVISCPPATTEYLNEDCEFILPDFASSATIQDNCDLEPVIIQSPLPGVLLTGSGTSHEITLLARDAAGNEATCVFDITLEDNILPDVLTLNDTTVIITDATYEVDISMPKPVFYDNCGILSVVNDFNGSANASGTYPYGTTNVVYTVTDNNNNTAQFYQQVIVDIENGPDHGLIIPEGFSPNEDGLNDRFEILGIEQYPDNELRVFNVHGNEVYRMEEYDNSWDGTSASNLNKGGRLPTGTYYYALYLGTGSDFIKGFVYLRRE